MPYVHVVAHTHWDREWYHSAARFQARLSRLVGDLLTQLRRRPDLPSFLLDGQAVILADHLTRHPEDAAVIGGLLAEGRLECGPWYVLPDELLVSGEALIRNLVLGMHTVRRCGGQPLAVGYSPDAFGHSGALPAILRGFGIAVAVAWRGFGGDDGAAGDLYRWRAPDGSDVLLVHLPRPGYEYGANLPADPAAARSRWGRLASLLGPRARTEHWLVLAGADHHALPPDLPEAVEAMREASGADVRLGRLEAYADAVREAAGDLALPAVDGELRGGRRHTWALQGTHGARLILKRWNAHCQRLLERAAEPLAALARARAGADLAAELRAAWTALLENHPHDSICGTSADEVHREMLVRFRRCRDMAHETIARGFDAVTDRDAPAARLAGRMRWQPALLAFNPEPAPRTAVVEGEVALFITNVGVGLGSKPARIAPGGEPFVLRDARGAPVPFQELSRTVGYDLVESPRHYPDCDAVEVVRVALLAELPPAGVAVIAVHEGETAPPPALEHPVTVGAATLENEHVFVRVADDGTLEIADFAAGEHYTDVGAIEDVTDMGDSYTSSPRGTPERLAPDAVAVEVVAAGPVRGTLEVVRTFAGLDLTMRVTLDHGARSVDFSITGFNRTPDRRLRFVTPLGARPESHLADGHFGPVNRVDAPPPGMRKGDLEATPPTHPMQRYVTVTGAGRGLTVFSDGLPEYEVTPGGDVLVTLLRGFGELSKADLPERPGHAGWPTPTPEGQCLGPFGARLAVMPQGARTPAELTPIEREAARFHAAPFARMVRALLTRPADIPGPRLEGGDLVVSAIKPADDGRGVVLRCYNAADSATSGAWTVPWPVTAASLCRLDETELTGVEAVQGRIAFDAGPRAIVTVRVR